MIFFLAQQLSVAGELYNCRTDLVGFVNGLPLVFIELKAGHRRLAVAYRDNLRKYKQAIPQLFWYNALVILSNGTDSKIGSITSEWEHFAEWKKINSEGEEGVISLETMLRGTCEPHRLLDIVENFVIYSEGQAKIVAKNHQYLGVNSAVQAVHDIAGNQGRLGVFWHTQGSGKSFSMVFFTQKIMRKLPGNWTFVIITDRQELDKQIYRTFAGTGILSENHIQAESGKHLKRLLKEDHRFIFTLIHKFHNRDGKRYPKLSDRRNIIVITDEAHRSQYDNLALNMRRALPNAGFIGFTGTPLMAGEEKTRREFGDYVSIYNFRQSIEDGATVPLYYENRIPELQLINEDFNDDIAAILEQASLDTDQENKLEREFSREYHLITRDDRLETVAQDIVYHFLNRGHLGKAMVVCLDRFTAVRMYAKVRKHWQRYRAQLKEADQQELAEKIDHIDMAVVISQSATEIVDFQDRGLDIRPHRERLLKEDLEEKFKKQGSNLRLVFVCAMWMTGFDVPDCSTIYLDKPMRNHTLMQTIARANRVFPDKNNGLIVDYIGIFRNLQKALAIYGADYQAGSTPIADKQILVEELRRAIAETSEFCQAHGIDLQHIMSAAGFSREKLKNDAVEALLVDEPTRQKYRALARQVNKLYRAILPDPAGDQFQFIRKLIVVLSEKIDNILSPQVDISTIIKQITGVLDESIAAESYVIRDPMTEYQVNLIDLSKIDFNALKEHFANNRKRTITEKLKSVIAHKLDQMIRLNRIRINYRSKFQEMIDAYNTGSSNIEQFFQELVKFVQELNQEEQRTITENLTEEELALFDLLTKPDPALKPKEEAEVKKTAQKLLGKLKQEKLVLDWRKHQQTRAAVRVCIEESLDQLPRVYTPEIWESKCDLVYQHIFDNYFGADKSVYVGAAG